MVTTTKPRANIAIDNAVGSTTRVPDSRAKMNASLNLGAKPAPKAAAPKPTPRAAPRQAAKPDLLTSLRKDKAFMESIAPKPATKAAPKATPKAPATKRKSDYDNFMGN